MKRPALALAAFALLSLPAAAQDDVDLSWLMEGSYAAYSGTAEAVTGDIAISAQDWVWTVDTAGGASFDAEFVEQRSSAWFPGDGEVWAGAVMAITEDPGELENGNTLCGDADATYVVFTPIDETGMGALLQLAFYSGDLPDNYEDPGFCGTYNYELH